MLCEVMITQWLQVILILSVGGSGKNSRSFVIFVKPTYLEELIETCLLYIFSCWMLQSDNEYTKPTEPPIFNSMEPSPSSEATSLPATQEFPNVLWDPKFHYRVRKGPPLVPILSQINLGHTAVSYLSKIHLNVTHCLRLDLLSSLFPSGFPTETL
jgi:hypothetical protein